MEKSIFKKIFNIILLTLTIGVLISFFSIYFLYAKLKSGDVLYKKLARLAR